MREEFKASRSGDLSLGCAGFFGSLRGAYKPGGRIGVPRSIGYINNAFSLSVCRQLKKGSYFSRFDR